MIHHVSLPARDPLRVATVLAELLGGRVYRFPIFEGSYQVVSGDADGTMIEVYPFCVQLEPERGFVQADRPAAYHPFHLLLSLPLAASAIERIGAREGWRTDCSVAGLPGRSESFHLYRMWVENCVLVECVPEAMIGEYRRYMQFATLDAITAYRIEPAVTETAAVERAAIATAPLGLWSTAIMAAAH
jgi:hypothetical protein